MSCGTELATTVADRVNEHLSIETAIPRNGLAVIAANPPDRVVSSTAQWYSLTAW